MAEGGDRRGHGGTALLGVDHLQAPFWPARHELNGSLCHKKSSTKKVQQKVPLSNLPSFGKSLSLSERYVEVVSLIGLVTTLAGEYTYRF